MNRREAVAGIAGAVAATVSPFEGLAMSATQPAKAGVSREQASAFAKLALKGIAQEYPNKLDHVMTGPGDVKGPKALHPAFYGCFDWHSSVHGHWMLVRVLGAFPELPDIREKLAANLTEANLKAEADYFAQPAHKSFERTYGWAWLLKLAQELHGWDDADGKRWAKSVRPLTDAVVSRYLEFLPKQTYPIRTGVHPNTAFGLAFAHDFATATDHKPLRERIEERAKTYFLADVDYPAKWEPGGADFFSPALMEADLMRRVMQPAKFPAWFHRFLPGAATAEPKQLFTPATVSDRADLQIVHLDGLNLSRAWCMRGIAAALPKGDAARKALAASAAQHAEAALKHVASGHYGGEHWLASFAVYMLLSTPDPA